MKKTISFLLCFTMLLTMLGLFCFAEGGVNISFVKAELPDVIMNASCPGDGVEVEEVSAFLDAQQLTVQSVEKYSAQTHKEHIFFLVDLSVSLTTDYFEKMKDVLGTFADSENENTYFTLITFGEEINVPLQFSNDAKELKNVVDALENNQGSTKLFSAFSKAIEISKSTELTDMEYAVVFTDGEDWQYGDVTEKEVEKQLDNAAMPLYAMCANTGKVSSENIENVRTLVSLSGGKFYLYKSTETESTFNELLDTVHSQYIIKATAANNVLDGKNQSLFIKVNDVQSNTVVLSSKSQTDSVPPSLSKDVAFDKKTNTLTFFLSEPVINKKGEAPSKAEFSLLYKNGKKLGIADFDYRETDGTYSIVLVPEKLLANGNYSLSAKNVTDDSMEKNALEPLDFSIENGHTKFVAFFLNNRYVFLIVLAAGAAVFLVILFIRKKNKPIAFNGSKQESVKIGKASGLPIVLYIDAGDGVLKTVKYELIKSAIVGRSKNCDIMVDDVKMSRQHFCLGIDKNNLVVADLHTTNGTYLNGVLMSSPQVLKSGDRIYAGVTTISIEF